MNFAPFNRELRRRSDETDEQYQKEIEFFNNELVSLSRFFENSDKVDDLYKKEQELEEKDKFYKEMLRKVNIERDSLLDQQKHLEFTITTRVQERIETLHKDDIQRIVERKANEEFSQMIRRRQLSRNNDIDLDIH